MCVSGWTVVSRTPGYTPQSDTSPACVRNPSLLADAASTGGTWSAGVWHQPTNYITSDVNHESGYNLQLLLHLLPSPLMKSDPWCIPSARLRNKNNSSGAGCELIVDVCAIFKKRENSGHLTNNQSINVKHLVTKQQASWDRDIFTRNDLDASLLLSRSECVFTLRWFI